MHFDLVIIGAGSGNSVLTPDHDDWKVAMIEKGVFGGTCLNRGCIPSKMLVLAADSVEQVREAARLGVDLSVDAIHWPQIRDRVFGRIDPIASDGESYRQSLANVTVFSEHARFTGPKQLRVGDTTVSGEQIVVAAGARPFIPPFPGIDDVPYHTSDDIMRLDEVPERLVILGAGFIAIELAHVFGSFGSAVTIVHRRNRVLRDEDEEISDAATAAAAERFDLVIDSTVRHVGQEGDEIVLSVESGSARRELRADVLLVAAGRVPNTDQLDVGAAGLAIDAAGYIEVDSHMRTTVDGVWALGDICNPDQLKHTANAEARIVAHNTAHPDDQRAVDLWPTPHAVFGSPQVASVGATEQQLRSEGRPYVKAVEPYGDSAYGWGLEDTTSFCKLLADPESRLLLGAHIIGPQASTLIQLLIQGMKFGQTVDELATGQLWIHPALPEVVENALLAL